MCIVSRRLGAETGYPPTARVFFTLHICYYKAKSLLERTKFLVILFALRMIFFPFAFKGHPCMSMSFMLLLHDYCHLILQSLQRNIFFLYLAVCNNFPLTINYRVFIKYCFFPKNSPKFASSPSPALVCYWLYWLYQPIVVTTVHSHCDGSFESLLQRCRRGRGCREL